MFESVTEQKIRAKMTWAIDRDAAAAAEPDALPVLHNSDDLDRFIYDYFGIALPSRRICSHHSTPHAAFHDAYFAKDPVAVWKASRAFGGKTFTLSLLGLVEALALRADVNVLGGSGEQSQRILESMTKLWACPTAPTQFLKSEPGLTKTVLIWGNIIKALMASQRSVRGPHPQRLRLDEVDEMDPGILESALGQPMTKGDIADQIVISSTHQYPDGTMAGVLARASERNWPVHEWCYLETSEPHGWLTKAQIERKRIVLTALTWKTEVELQEPNAEDRAIDQDAVRAMFVKGEQEDGPDGESVYAHGADWARKQHNTCVVTLKKPDTPDPDPDSREPPPPKGPLRLVKIEVKTREPWPTMVGYLESRVRTFGGAAIHDGTGVGDVVAGYLNVEAEAFIMVGKARADLLTEYVHAIEHGEVIVVDDGGRDVKTFKKEHTFATNDDLYGSGHLPDTIAAGALAYRAARTAAGGSGVMQDPPGTKPSILGSGFKRRGGIFSRRR